MKTPLGEQEENLKLQCKESRGYCRNEVLRKPVSTLGRFQNGGCWTERIRQKSRN